MITTNIVSIQDDPVGEANAEILKLMSIKQQGQTNHSGINFKHDDSNLNIGSSQILHPDISTTRVQFQQCISQCLPNCIPPKWDAV